MSDIEYANLDQTAPAGQPHGDGVPRVPSPRRLVELESDRALALVAGRAPGIGRLGFCMFDTAHIDVVNFLVDKGDLIFRSDANAKLMAVGRGVHFTFQVDDIDPVTRTGWTVTVVGPVHRVHGAEADALSERLTSWADGDRRFVMRLTPRRVFGRLLVNPD